MMVNREIYNMPPTRIINRNLRSTLAILLCSFAINTSADEISAQELLQEQNIKIRSELNSQTLATFNHQYPDYQIGKYCQGSFTHPQAKEFLIAAVPKKNSDKIFYFLLLSADKKNYTVKKFDQDSFENTQYYTSAGIPSPTITSMYCQTAQDTRNLWFLPGDEDWQNGPPSRDLSSFCINKEGSSYEYQCYEYNKETKNFHMLYGSFYSDCTE